MIWSVTTVALLLVLCLQSQKTCSFAPQSETRRSGRVFNALPIAVNNQDQQTVPEISDSLVQLLVLPSNDKDEKKKDLIQSLAKQLIDAQVSFDPTQCVNDKSLYFSNVLDGPSPLWERLGFASNNIQGQQYTYRDDEKSVINYAEIFGSGLHLRAYGTYESDESSLLLSKKESPPAASFLDTVLGILENKNKQTSQSTMIQCPADFVVTVNKASIFMGSQSVINIPISGTGYLRVLYADPKLRIFVSPQSTTDDRWEKAGLTVAQISIEVNNQAFERLE